MAKLKHCTRCRKIRPKENFGVDKRTVDLLRSWCKECCNESNREQYQKHKARHLAKCQDYLGSTAGRITQVRHNLRKVGIREEDLDVAVRRFLDAAQCDLCGKAAEKYATDHCHDSGAFRGILCDRCNLGLGHLGDDILGVRAALDYLVNARSAQV